MQFIQAAFYGLGAGFLMSVLLGAIFFLLINQSLQNGWKSSYPIALGVITVDSVFVFLAILFTSKIQSFLNLYSNHINIIGGLVLIAFGIVQILKTNKSKEVKIKNGGFYITALSINLMNPANAAWWLSLYSIAPMNQYAIESKVVFGIAAIIAIFLSEVGIAYSALFLKRWLSEANIKKLNKTVGFVFVGLGLRLCLSFLF